jgi:peroxiredoxin Q/BCP
MSAPDFCLPDQTGTTRCLNDLLRGTQGLVVYFYPQDDTPGCTTQACDLRDANRTIVERGFGICGISPDSVVSHERFASKYALNFPILADPEMSVIDAYGVYGVKMLYGKSVTGLLRSTFLLAPDGTITHALYNVRAKGHADRVARLLGVS